MIVGDFQLWDRLVTRPKKFRFFDRFMLGFIGVFVLFLFVRMSIDSDKINFELGDFFE